MNNVMGELKSLGFDPWVMWVSSYVIRGMVNQSGLEYSLMVREFSPHVPLNKWIIYLFDK